MEHDKEMTAVSYIPTPEQAEELVKQYNKEPFHIEHAEIVSKIMGIFAEEYDPDRVQFWETVGMLHDIDFEQWPDEHCSKANDMEKVLFAVDELSGLIGAAARMRPNGISDMPVKSLAKKFKDKKFAAGCSREVITRGAEMMGVELNTLFEKTLEAMKKI